MHLFEKIINVPFTFVTPITSETRRTSTRERVDCIGTHSAKQTWRTGTVVDNYQSNIKHFYHTLLIQILSSKISWFEKSESVAVVTYQ
jgi:hypothetical protein